MNDHTSEKKLSVVLAAHDKAADLEKNLPSLLEQEYEPGFEVSVVDESSTDETEEVLKQLKARYPHLYTTYIPASSHYVSRRKLALTIGMKAAHHEWVIITEADCHPENGQWLSAMAATMTDDLDVVCGYTAYEKGTKARYAFLRMLTYWRQGCRPYRYDGANIGIRKSWFMEQGGFLHNLKYLRGEYDFLVNEAGRDRIAVTRTPECRLRQSEPTKKSWKNHQLYHMQVRTHLQHALLPRMFFGIHQALLHLIYWGAIAAIVLSILRQDMVCMVASSAFLLLLVSLHTFLAYRLTKTYGEHIAPWKLPFLGLYTAWHYLYYRLRYLMSDKYDFRRK